MRDSSNPDSLQSSMQELIDENEYLREKLAATETASKFRQELHQILSGAINIGYWEWDETTKRAAYFSEEMATILGMSRESLYELYQCEEDYFQLVYPDDLEHYIDNLSAVLNPKHPRGSAHTFGYRIVRPNGEVRHLLELEYGVLKENGVITRSYGAVQDITYLQESARALTESEQRYSSLFSNLPLGVMEQDWSKIKKAVDKLQSEGIDDLREYLLNNSSMLQDLVNSIVIRSVNEKLLEILRASSLEEIVEDEEDVSSWWDEEWADLYATEIAIMAGPRKINYSEMTELRMDDSVFETRLITSIVKGDEDSWKRVLTIVEDVTERKNYETNLLEAKTMAEKASKAKTEFLSNMSHELRTPLNAILGFSQLFEYDRTLGEHQQSNAREINNAGQHLLTLIEEILDLSRIEAGKLELSMETVTLVDVIRESVSWVTDIAQSRGVSIQFDPVTCQGLMVRADAIRLKQVFLNLLSNAVKYNREGGSVSIVCTEDENDCVRIGIKDTGPGILNDQLGALFQPFNRLGAEFSAIEGTGIGLVITKHLINLMQGELEVDSVPGEGSTFTVQLQAMQSKKPDVTSNNIEDESPGEATITSFTIKPNVLVAEDNPVNRQLMAAQMELLGFTADYAENGVEALKQWRAGNYNLLLTDIRMPEMDGYELMRQIRAIESKTATSVIIAVTANAMESDIKRCYDTGANDVISKPFTLDELKQMLKKWAPPQEELVPGPAVLSDIAQHDAIDLSVLKQSIGESFETHCQLLTSYVNALPEALEDIQQAFAWSNHEQLADYAHRLKSSSGSMGATQLADTCQTLELAGREGRVAEIESSVPRLTRYAEQVTHFVAEYCESSPLATAGEPTLDSAEDMLENDLCVLVVDDDYIMHQVSTLILNDLGIGNVVTALSGQRALEILDAKSTGIDVVICDLNMPQMDGVEFTRHLARQGFSGSLIFSSGEDIRILKTVEKLAIEHELQVLGVLEKPVTQAKLRELLNALDPTQTEATLIKSRTYSVAELSHAINGGELDTYFQPKVDVLSRQVVGVEALVRWNHPIDGIINPLDFIPLIEENNLIFELTQAVCEKALLHAAQWQAQGFNLDFAINISVNALHDLGWPDEIAARIEAAGLQPSTVTFEITESQLIQHLVVSLDILSRLSLKRFKLSIDDFGTGYSSMEQLQRIPFSELKIDRAFVRGAGEDASARAILESSVLLAKKLDMKIVAEGVETEEDWNLIAELGCDQVQGYYIAKPMPIAELCHWLAQWQKSPR